MLVKLLKCMSLYAFGIVQQKKTVKKTKFFFKLVVVNIDISGVGIFYYINNPATKPSLTLGCVFLLLLLFFFHSL